EVAVARVRLLGRGETRVLADRPRPPAVHVRVRPTREGVFARRLELARRVSGGVDRLYLDAGLGAPVAGRCHAQIVGLSAYAAGWHRERTGRGLSAAGTLVIRRGTDAGARWSAVARSSEAARRRRVPMTRSLSAAATASTRSRPATKRAMIPAGRGILGRAA